MKDSLQRLSVSSGSPLEPEIGFSRAVRVGAFVAVSGTAPLDDAGATVAPDDVYLQTKRCLEIVIAALEKAGAKAEDTIRTRVILTDIERWREAARAHGEVFGAVQPACTFVEVNRFIGPEWLVEIEADAVIGNDC